jgi:hypothetical protein
VDDGDSKAAEAADAKVQQKDKIELKKWNAVGARRAWCHGRLFADTLACSCSAVELGYRSRHM